MEDYVYEYSISKRKVTQDVECNFEVSYKSKQSREVEVRIKERLAEIQGLRT